MNFRNLDMSKYLINTSIDPSQTKIANNVYDLCGVINHLGQSISMGHYTAFARTHDRDNTLKNEIGWRHFDDERVASFEVENHVLTKDAYVLMYRLRSSDESNSEELVSQKKQDNSSTQTTEASDIPIISNNLVEFQEQLLEKGSDSENEDQKEEFYDIESEESAQLDDDSEDRDEAIDLSENEDNELSEEKSSDFVSKCTDLNETD